MIEQMEVDGLGFRRRTSPPKFIVLHHTNTRSAADTRKVLSMRGLSTHYEVDEEGRCYEYLCPEHLVSFHAGAFNGRSIGVDATHLHKVPWPEVQVDACHRLVCHLLRRFDLPLSVAPTDARFKTPEEVVSAGYTVIRHSNVKATLCPDGLPMPGEGVPA